MQRSDAIGFTLLEFMLAIVLSGIITWDVVHVAVGLEMEIYRQQQSMQQLESARAISYLFSNAARLAEGVHCHMQSIPAIVEIHHNSLVLMQCIYYHERWQMLPIRYFIAPNQHGRLSLYQQPADGNRQAIEEEVIAFEVDAHHPPGVIVWLLLRSSQSLFSSTQYKQCYYFLDRTYCPRDGYRYLAWPIYVS